MNMSVKLWLSRRLDKSTSKKHLYSISSSIRERQHGDAERLDGLEGFRFLVRSAPRPAAAGISMTRRQWLLRRRLQVRLTGLALAEPLLVDPLVRVVLTQCQKRFVHVLAQWTTGRKNDAVVFIMEHIANDPR